jgi:hypothetical protein
VADYPPVANAGADLSIMLPSNTITLRGSGTDSDGTVVSYVWSKYSGPSATLTNKSTPTLTASNLQLGTYVFRLTVKDNAGVQAVDYATVIVITLGGRSASAPVDSDVIEESQTPEFILSDENNAAIENSMATIYDERGEKIFEGNWNASMYRQVFNQKGLYIYNLSKNGKRMSGKVYVTDGY